MRTCAQHSKGVQSLRLQHLSAQLACSDDSEPCCLSSVGFSPEHHPAILTCLDLYFVRVFNDSGDVNQGQGLVYGSSLVIAYTQCEGRLAWLRATEEKRKWRMIVSMSVGAPGPLTIEKMYFQ